MRKRDELADPCSSLNKAAPDDPQILEAQAWVAAVIAKQALLK